MTASLFAFFPWIIISVIAGYWMGYRDGKQSKR
jgi:hypothetical protein